MRTFARITKIIERTAHADTTRPSRYFWGQSRDAHSMLYLQRMIGNQAVARLPQIARANADVSAANGSARDFSQIPVQSTVPGNTQPRPREQRADWPRDAGKPLDRQTRRRMGSLFDFDFGAVRVHDDQRAAESAAALGAKAYTFGNHIVFGRGQSAGSSRGDSRLLKHELAHVVQQSSAELDSSVPTVLAPVSGLEREADAVAQSPRPGAAGLTRGLTRLDRPSIQRIPDPDGEINRQIASPPPLSIRQAIQLAIMQSLRSPTPSGPDLMAMPPAVRPPQPAMGSFEALLSHRPFQVAIRTMARDLKRIAMMPWAGEYTAKQKKELLEMGIKRVRTIDPVVVVAKAFGAFESIDEGRKEIVKALQGLPPKLFEAALEPLILEVTKAVLRSFGQSGEPAARVEPGTSTAGAHDPLAPYGPEVGTFEPIPIVGQISFDLDLPSTPERKARPGLRLLNGGYGGQFTKDQVVQLWFDVNWYQSKEAGPTGGLNEGWRIEVRTAKGEKSTGLPGLGGWQGLDQRLSVKKNNGLFKFPAPRLPGRYQARLVNWEGVKDTVYFTVRS